MNYITTAEAADRLGVSRKTVNNYCNSIPQIIKAKKFGRSWQIEEDSLEYIERPKRGQPKRTN